MEAAGAMSGEMNEAGGAAGETKEEEGIADRPRVLLSLSLARCSKEDLTQPHTCVAEIDGLATAATGGRDMSTSAVAGSTMVGGAASASTGYGEYCWVWR